MTLTYRDLPISTFIFFPLWSLLGLLNHAHGLPWQPQPQVYSFQVEAEIRYRQQQLINLFTAALDEINSGCFTTLELRNPAQETQILEAAIQKITSYQQKVRQRINESFSRWDYFHKSEDLVTLEKLEALGKQIHRRILAVRDIGNIYKVHYRRMERHLQQIRQSIYDSLSFEFSPMGMLALSQPLDAHIQKKPLLVGQQSSSAGNDSGSGVTDTTPHSHVFLYDLNSIDGTLTPIFRSGLAQLCEGPRRTNTVSGILHMICTVQALAAMMSDPDDDTLSGVQRSWVVERQKAIRRYKRQNGWDEKSMVSFLVDVGQHKYDSLDSSEYVEFRMGDV